MINKVRKYFAMLIAWHKDVYRGARDRRRRREFGFPEYPTIEEIYSAPYCFVLSTGRSGTAFLTEILSSSPELSVHHAPKPELEYASSLVHRQKPAPEALDLAVLAARFELFVDAYRSGAMYVETNNRITFFAPALARLLPNARFIHVVRHPADFVRSGMRRGYYAEGVVQHQRLMPADNAQWSSYSELEKIAWEWNEINACIEDFKASVPADRVLTVTSEMLFGDRQALLSVLDFIGVADDPVVTRKVTSGSLKPVNQQTSGRFPKHEQWPDTDKAALKRVATLAAEYGYDL